MSINTSDEPQAATPTWKKMEGHFPYSCMQMLVVDNEHRLFQIHRSNNVRSAKNCWSHPSGLHDIGEYAHECAARELQEEFGLSALSMMDLGVYENITDEIERYHWVIRTIGVRVEDCTKFVNKEPDKHDKVEILPIHEIAHPAYFERFNFHPTFQRWAQRDIWRLVSNLTKVASDKSLPFEL